MTANVSPRAARGIGRRNLLPENKVSHPNQAPKFHCSSMTNSQPRSVQKHNPYGGRHARLLELARKAAPNSNIEETHIINSKPDWISRAFCFHGAPYKMFQPLSYQAVPGLIPDHMHTFGRDIWSARCTGKSGTDFEPRKLLIAYVPLQGRRSPNASI
jgi:hypothetical protein